MKKYILLLFLFYFAKPVVAKHITGGEVIYDYTGLGSSNSKKYKITLRLFRDNFCTGCATMPGFVTLAIYDNDNNQRVGSYLNVPITNTDPLQIIFSQPCLTNAPMFDYSAGYYQFVADLPNNNNGYTVAFQTCCRVDGIANAANSQSATYMGEIPGNNTLVGDITDNSARFETGISIICANKPFTLDFSAIDPDGDNLQYDYYSAYNGGGATDASYATPVAPSYGSINYLTPYSGFNQFGTFATINTNTGFITGQAPSAGKYVVSVKVRSYRAGNYIATHRKDFIITVAPCDFASADLGNPNVKVNCYSLNTSFANLNTSPLNLTFDWEFGDPASGVLNSSTDEFPSHLFSAPGNYWVKLTVNKNTTCNSTDSLLVKVWPGFNPAFAPIPSQC
ncbi:MAG: PKD domain-containing protein, partial [Ferruginibacter sp.]